MDPTSGMLLTIAAIFLIGIAGELVFERTGVPDVVWLIIVGILLGPVTGLVSRAQLLSFAPYFGAITLIVVLFNGGTQLRLADLGRAAPRASLLAITAFVASVAVVTVVSVLAAKIGLLSEHWTWTHGALLGAIVGGSSSVVIMPSVEKAKLPAEVGNLFNLESALTDILCVVVAGALIQVLTSGQASVGAAAGELAKAFAIGIMTGAGVGFGALFALRHLMTSAYAYPLTLAALMLLYVATNALGGSAALAVLTGSIILGNAPSLGSRVGLSGRLTLADGVTGVHAQVTFIVKSFFFTLIGAMLAPPWSLIALGVVLGGVLVLARWPAVRLSLWGQGSAPGLMGLATSALPRGMAAGVLSMMPMQAGVPGTSELPVVVFATATTTIVLFAGGFRHFSRRLVTPDTGVSTATAPETQVA